jgi:hypothetical protein
MSNSSSDSASPDKFPAILERIELREHRARRRAIIYFTLPVALTGGLLAYTTIHVREAAVRVKAYEERASQLAQEISDAQGQLDEMNLQKAAAQDQLKAIKTEVEQLRASLEVARQDKPKDAAVLDAAINKTDDIGKAISETNGQLQAQEQPPLTSLPISEYRVGLQTLGVSDEERVRLNQKLRDEGYTLHESSVAYPKDARPSWFASRSTVFYYAKSARAAAKHVATAMKKLTGEDFAVRRGAGLGVVPGEGDLTLFVHYVKN